MKKIVLIVGLAACGVAQALTNAEITNEAVRIATIAASNIHVAQNAYFRSPLCGLNSRSAATLAADDILATAGICGNRAWSAFIPTCVLPKVEFNTVRAHSMTNKAPVLTGLAKKYRLPMTLNHLKPLTMGETLSLLEEYACTTNYGVYAMVSVRYVKSPLDKIRRAIQDRGLIAVKHKLRAEGKSFVTRKGVNPCASYMESLTAALNAPKFQGLNDWMAGMGITNRIDMSSFPSDAELASLRASVLNGDTEITDEVKRTLAIGLGTESYNAFVKEYNGEE